MAEIAFEELIAAYRRELLVHCYRLLGSLTDAEDVLQEALLAAWRGLGDFQGRASLRSWLYRIATNRCLNALRDRGRRIPPAPDPPFQPPQPSRHTEAPWLQPYPDDLTETTRVEGLGAGGVGYVTGDFRVLAVAVPYETELRVMVFSSLKIVPHSKLVEVAEHIVPQL